MTIHKAKGLEFPLVALADAGYTGGFRSALFYLDQELGLVLNLSDGEAQPAAFRLAACRAAEQEAAEERRLLYVAATRAMDKLIISGDAKLSQAKATPGRLLVSGWLAQLAGVVGLSELQLPTMPTTPQSVSLEWGGEAVACTIYPPVKETVPASAIEADLASPVETPTQLPDLLPPLTVAPGTEVDEKLQARESDPPPRVWRVVPKTKYEVPAWVVGSLTHIALRHWRFPDSDSPSTELRTGFADFLRPFALEAGLTDPASIDIALSRVSRLLTRFQAHPLYTQLSAAERHHELPYTLTIDSQLHSGIIDLLFRTSPEAAWTIAEFKTDRLPERADLRKYVQQKGYDRQVGAYRQAITQQLDTTPKILLIFLNVGQSVQVLSLED
jgi:ATP-dependent exoDNAse (exonuclease V) beta subunit